MIARRAFTLLEVLLTLCLLVVLASLTWPSLGRPLANQRLRSAADEVRAEWARARVKAISQARIYGFRYTPEGNQYLVQAQSEPDAETEAPGFGVSPESERPADLSTASREHRLSEGVRFMTPEVGGGTGDIPPGVTAAGAETGDWAGPILFYPDGTASDAVVRLVNESGASIQVSLRGLTGMATVGPLVFGEGS